MKRLRDEIIRFFEKQGFVVMSTLDHRGTLHTSCKGLVKIQTNGKVYLLDLYKEKTFANLKRNPHTTITAVDEHRFVGYSLKGKARILGEDKLTPHIIKAWEERITGRMTRRLIRNIQGEKGHSRHPEALLPKPEYMIVVEVSDIVNLTPQHINIGG